MFLFHLLFAALLFTKGLDVSTRRPTDRKQCHQEWFIFVLCNLRFFGTKTRAGIELSTQKAICEWFVNKLYWQKDKERFVIVIINTVIGKTGMPPLLHLLLHWLIFKI